MKIILQKLKKVEMDNYLLAERYYTILSAINDLKLTPREIEICNMIKSGLTTKEISNFLNSSSQTIDKHRKNIRKKLGLTQRYINLTSFLQSL